MRELLSAWRWPLGLVGLLAMNAAAQGILYFAASHDASHAVETDYYRKAIGFDAQRAAERASDSLGWSAAVEARPRAIGIRVTDAAGRPIEGASVRVDAFHNARANDVQSLLCESRGDGRYEASGDLSRPGTWILRVEVTRGAERFAQEVRRQVGAAGESR